MKKQESKKIAEEKSQLGTTARHQKNLNSQKSVIKEEHDFTQNERAQAETIAQAQTVKHLLDDKYGAMDEKRLQHDESPQLPSSMNKDEGFVRQLHSVQETVVCLPYFLSVYLYRNAVFRVILPTKLLLWRPFLSPLLR